MYKGYGNNRRGITNLSGETKMNLCRICPIGWYNDWKLKHQAKKVLNDCLKLWAANRFWNAVGQTQPKLGDRRTNPDGTTSIYVHFVGKMKSSKRKTGVIYCSDFYKPKKRKRGKK